MRLIALILLTIVTLTSCSTAVTGSPTASAAGLAATEQVTKGEAAKATDREVCVDFDARGGALYEVFVVPMMTVASGQKSIDVNVDQMTRATLTVARVGSSMKLTDASTEIRNQTERMVKSAEAFGIYDHTEGTALLTSFVSLAVACTSAGQKPTWFDPTTLTST